MDFTVVTPSYRQLDWLSLCVASVADQAGKLRVEHIVQDGGSPGIEGVTDRIGAFLREAHGGEGEGGLAPGEIGRFKTPAGYRLRVFSGSDRGMYDAVNKGLRGASGHLCAYLNCDEQYLPGALESVAAALRSRPAVEVLFGDVVIVDKSGGYLCSRKISIPWLWHTWVCTLPVYTAATFFRKDAIAGRGYFFPEGSKAAGDSIWMMELLRHGIRMAKLGGYAAAATETGSNLVLSPAALEEQRALVRSAPAWMRVLAPVWKVAHRAGRLLDGAYRVPPFSYAIHTCASPGRRVSFDVRKPGFSLPGRFGRGSG